jgi:hypothetical protein
MKSSAGLVFFLRAIGSPEEGNDDEDTRRGGVDPQRHRDVKPLTFVK